MFLFLVIFPSLIILWWEKILMRRTSSNELRAHFHIFISSLKLLPFMPSCIMRDETWRLGSDCLKKKSFERGWWEVLEDIWEMERVKGRWCDTQTCIRQHHRNHPCGNLHPHHVATAQHHTPFQVFHYVMRSDEKWRVDMERKGVLQHNYHSLLSSFKKIILIQLIIIVNVIAVCDTFKRGGKNEKEIITSCHAIHRWEHLPYRTWWGEDRMRWEENVAIILIVAK